MLRSVVDTKLAVVAADLAPSAEVGEPSRMFRVVAVALLGMAALWMVRRVRCRTAERARGREQQAMDARLRALVDDHGGLLDRCVHAEAERGLGMLDRWRSTHSP